MEFIFEIFFYLDNIVANNYLFSLAIFSLVVYFYATFSIPGIPIIWLFSGYAFGIYIGYLLSAIFTSIGSLNLFILSKTIFHTIFKNKFYKYIKKVDKKIKNDSYEILIMFRLSPINIPFFFQNIVLSFLKISIYKYIITTFIGLSPSILFIVIIGSAISRIDDLRSFDFNELLSKEFIFLYLIIFCIILLIIIVKNKIKKH